MDTILFLLSWVFISFVCQQWLKTKPPKGLNTQKKRKKKNGESTILIIYVLQCLPHALFLRVVKILPGINVHPSFAPRLLYLE